MRLIWKFILLVAVVVSACTPPESHEFEPSIPDHVEPFKWADDRVPSVEEIKLGEDLFFSNLLSSDSSISCASCHIPSRAFSDTARVSMGIHAQQGFRNTPSIFNVAWRSHFFLEGGVNSLERATLGPMLTEEEMSLQAPELLDRLSKTPELHISLVEVFGEDYGYKEVVSSLSNFQRSLISLDSDWDNFKQGRSLTSLQERGLLLFKSDSLSCATCHVPPFFRDEEFHDLGMPISEPVDYGRGRFTFDSTDFYTFSTPSLRNVELTEPYMHDGSIPTLDSVVRFYEHGGGPRPNTLNSFNLSDSDRVALIEFLKALTGRKARTAKP